jgi:succinate dehydrogenase hydrophobic anchor subunit
MVHIGDADANNFVNGETMLQKGKHWWYSTVFGVILNIFSLWLLAIRLAARADRQSSSVGLLVVSHVMPRVIMNFSYAIFIIHFIHCENATQSKLKRR